MAPAKRGSNALVGAACLAFACFTFSFPMLVTTHAAADPDFIKTESERALPRQAGIRGAFINSCVPASAVKCGG